VLGVLWRAAGPLAPAEVMDRLSSDLAYTTVTTILTRLWRKGLVTRDRIGRAFHYRAAVSEADLTAARMRTALAASSDRFATMNRFVGELSAREVRALRTILDELER
jgi:predicted transcriptional regulator